MNRRVELYLQKVRDHICVRCGKTDEHTLAGHVKCQECAEKHREYMREHVKQRTDETRKNDSEWRKRLKEAHVCLRCKEQDAYTLRGRTYCERCAGILSKRKRDSMTDERKVQGAIRSKAARDKWREEGRCTRCGRENKSKYRTCMECRTHFRNRRRENRKCNYPRGGNGICWQCNKEPVVEGKHLCKNCIEMKLKCLNKAWAVKPDDHPWRKFGALGGRYSERNNSRQERNGRPVDSEKQADGCDVLGRESQEHAGTA